MAPNRVGPAWVVVTSPDDMDMQLRHQIADPGDVDLGIGQLLRQVIRDPLAIGQHPIALWDGQIQQIGQLRLGNQDEPRHQGIAVEQQVALGQLTKPMTISQELRVEGEGMHGELGRADVGSPDPPAAVTEWCLTFPRPLWITL